MSDNVLLITAEPRLEDAVLAAAAAVRVEVRVAPNLAAASGDWALARAVLVGWDLAGAVVEAGPPGRGGVYLLAGLGGTEGEAAAWSMPLSAPVIVLPEGSGWLSRVLLGKGDSRADSGPVVAVMSGSGGIGGTTLTVGLAVRAALGGVKVALVDADPAGGGIDLLLGAEGEPGWRWPQLAGARGQIGDLRGSLPNADGVDLLAMSRGEPSASPLADALPTVVGALARTHQLVLVDVGGGWGEVQAAGLAAASRCLLLVGQDVLAVASCRQRLLASRPPQPSLVVRARGSDGVAPAVVARTLGLPLLGVLPSDPTLTTLAERGEPPGRQARQPWSEACARLLGQVTS